MSINTNMENTKREEHGGAKCFGDELLGVKNAVKNFVEAKKGEESAVDKGKKQIIMKAMVLKAGKRGKK